MKLLKSRLVKYLEHCGKVQTRQVLLTLSDRQIEDAGFSKTLLLKGVKEWPWPLDNGETTAPANPVTGTAPPSQSTSHTGSTEITNEQMVAVTELENMSDGDLNDIGITRGKIRYAVINTTEDRAA